MAGTDRVVSVQSGGKILSCQDTGDQSGGGATVTYIQGFRWGDKSMETFSTHQDFVLVCWISIPILRKQEIVERQSAPSRK